MAEVSELLSAIQEGDPHAASQLLPLVYDELRRLAAHKLSHETPGQTLQPTALVHEAYLRLVGRDPHEHWDGRGHFFAAAAETMRLHRVVAIKVLASALSANGTARKRFVREGQAAAAVSHDHVVAIHAVQDTGPVPYLVMQYVAGISLQQRVTQGGPLELKEILRIGMQTAAGLAAAHAQGLVHRDVTPANILLENGVQRVKITDFGLARAVDDASLTQSGVIAGTPMYMSPEQRAVHAVYRSAAVPSQRHDGGAQARLRRDAAADRGG